MDIQVKLLCIDDADELFAFEVRNRTYFERIGLGHGADYYQRNSFQASFSELIAEQEKGVHYLYGVWLGIERMIGRINLYNVERGIFDKAEIGFRLDPAFQGQGIMTRALEVVLDQAISVYRLYRVEARTASYNAVSQRVLEKAGFEYIGKWRAYFNFDGVRHDCWLYEKIIGG